MEPLLWLQSSPVCWDGTHTSTWSSVLESESCTGASEQSGGPGHWQPGVRRLPGGSELELSLAGYKRPLLGAKTGETVQADGAPGEAPRGWGRAAKGRGADTGNGSNPAGSAVCGARGEMSRYTEQLLTFIKHLLLSGRCANGFYMF